jgi:filamentous hemagglutinin family protein
VSGAGKAVFAASAKPVTRLRCHQLSFALVLVFSALAQAAPTEGVVTAGQASIGGTPGRMTVTQTTAHAAINWQSFGIRAGESVQFVQPSSTSVALNRVIGADPSAILGHLSANGQVFLVNPSGILFGLGASVNVGGLVASTLNISDADFMAGRYRFSGVSPGTVVNQGLIQAADGGYVALLGSQVSNSGRVVAQLGIVALAAGQAVTLDISGDQLLNVAIDQGVAKALLSNGGWLQADGGQVLMTTQVAGNLLANAVNNTGVVQAQSLAHRNGSIFLLGSMDAGTVHVGGTLDVSGGPGQTGGRVVVTAHQAGLFHAQIQASGETGGGVVLVGGDYRGQNQAVPHAAAVYMSADSAIHADARVQGDGGKIVLWSDGTTRAHGLVSARGGGARRQGWPHRDLGPRIGRGGAVGRHPRRTGANRHLAVGPGRRHDFIGRHLRRGRHRRGVCPQFRHPFGQCQRGRSGDRTGRHQRDGDDHQHRCRRRGLG